MVARKTISTNDAWEKLIDKYDIISEIREKGIFKIKADEIKEFKEPRLMAKWDSSEQLPKVFKDKRINILPDSRGSYVLSDFELYQEFPDITESNKDIKNFIIPHYETIDINNITSEANAINVLCLSKILDDFLDTDENVVTFNGRMGTGEFEFNVNSKSGVIRNIEVKNAQCEIDSGFENSESVVIMEAKNVLHKDFHIRQLYYPYRLWKSKVKKPIRLVYSVYVNKIFRLYEYRFKDENDYSSIEFIQMKNYSLQDTKITKEDLKKVRETTPITTDDNMENGSKIPFIQANVFERIISILESIYKSSLDGILLEKEDIADIMKFDVRQADYYFNAGRYLGIFENIEDSNKKTKKVLTELGKEIYLMNYKDRQLKLVSLILEHRIFAELFDLYLEKDDISNEEIKSMMKKYNVCGNSLIERRASSVRYWIKWIFNLTEA